LPTQIVLTRHIQSSKLWSPVRKAQVAAFVLALGVGGPMPLLAQAPHEAATVGPASLQLPTLGDGSDMTSAAERRLGDRIAREIYRDPDYIDDPVLGEYVQGIWQPLLAAARARGDLTGELDERFAWQVMLGRDRTVNAFALPGGYLGLHLGLIAVVGSRDELASVMGHELSHVTQRHISRLMSKQGQQTPWMIGAMILGILAASKSPDAGSALIVGGQAVAAQSQLNFSRDMEREADRVGFGVMTQAGFDGHGFVAMFDKLQQASRHNDSGAYPYLRSHPLTTERIADMQSRQPLGAATAVSVLPSAEHAMISARARVLSNPGVDALRAIGAEAQGVQLASLPAVRQAGILYGAALSANRLRDFETARDCLARLTQQVGADLPAQRLLRLLTLEVALASGDSARAAALLQASVAEPGVAGASDATQRRPELFLRAQLAMQVGQALQISDVAQRLQVWVLAHPQDAQAWQLLSSACAAQGQTLRAIRADAEAQMAVLDYAAALERFKAAQGLLRQVRSGTAEADHIDASIIDTRRRQVELLAKEQALER
jgi:predicted Zn-dependent protease